MKHMAMGMVAGLGVTALLALGLPARAQSGSGTSAPSASGQSSDKSGSSSSGSSTMGSGGSNSDTAGAGSSSNKSGSDTGSASSSSGTSGTGASASSGSGSSHQVSGNVKKYDKGSKELTLSNTDKKLKLNDDTKVTKNGQKASTSDIHEGDKVRASYSGSGDPVDVVIIEIVPADTDSSGTAK